MQPIAQHLILGQIGTPWQAAVLAHMRFYFDYQDSAGIIIDDQGEELPNFEAARDASMKFLAEAIRDHVPTSLTEKLSVLVRTEEVTIMTVSATLEVAAATPIGRNRNLS